MMHVRWRSVAVSVIGVALLLVGGMAALDAAAQQPKAGQLSFKALAGEETGLKAILEKWKADEQQRQKVDKVRWWPWGLVACDYDGDGCIDLIVQQHAAPGCILLRGLCKDKGTVQFANVSADVGLGNAALPSTFGPRLWDIDGDGWIDIVGTSNGGPGTFFNQQGKKFEPMKFTPGPVHELDTARHLRDLNGDGFLDFFSETTKFLYDPKARMFSATPFQPPLLANPPEAVAEVLREKHKIRFFHTDFTEADLNGDGGVDLVVGGFAAYSRDSLLRALIADKAGKYADRTAEMGLPTDGTPVLVADLDGDGAPEILVSGGGKAGLYRNDGAGKYTLIDGPVSQFLARQGPYAHTAHPAHFKNDGQVDLVLCNPRGGQTEIYENLGKCRFERVVQAGSWEEPVAIADFNNDGLLDAAIAGPRDTITIYLNQTAAAGKACRILPRMDKPNPFAAGARVEVFRAGELGKPGVKPFWSEAAHADGSPIHIGLGGAEAFDLRVTFPGKDAVEHKGVALQPAVQVTPDGKARRR